MGPIRAAADSTGPEPAPRVGLASLRVGKLELAALLGLVDLLFLAFVLVQARAFFGGRGWVTSHAHLTYAQYARQGFFELLAVVALALPLLLALDWLLRREQPGIERLFRLLAGCLVLLLLVVVASAVERMRLYQREYGLTELRVYSSAFILWLALLVVWFGLTVLLRDRRGLFALGTVVSGLAAIVALNALNPDALIARVDIDRAEQGKPVDVGYLAGLSEDAVPTIVSRARLDIRIRTDCTPDWRGWSLSRARARSLLCR